jgi:hypothetical protein
VVLDSEPGQTGRWWRYDCEGEGDPLRSIWLRDPVPPRSGRLLVEATMWRIVHPPIVEADGSWLPALVEYRLVRARVLDRGD